MNYTMAAGKQVKRVTVAILGGVVLLIGVALLVLPGPGLLLVLAGLLILASEFPALERHIDPVRDRAMKAAEDSVASPLRIAGSVLCGLALFAAGIIWGLRVFPWLPLPGWSTGSSIILSGVVLFALLGWSYKRVNDKGASDKSVNAKGTDETGAGETSPSEKSTSGESVGKTSVSGESTSENGTSDEGVDDESAGETSVSERRRP